MKMEGRAALITGAGRGIGRATALLFAREGADLALTSGDDSIAINGAVIDVAWKGQDIPPTIQGRR